MMIQYYYFVKFDTVSYCLLNMAEQKNSEDRGPHLVSWRERTAIVRIGQELAISCRLLEDGSRKT